MREFIIENLTNTESLQITVILMNNVVALVTAFFIMFTYKISYDGSAYSRKFNISLGSVTIITAMIMSVISNNVALSLGMVGALSIIRFRTAVKETFTDESQETAFKANVAKAYRSGFAELLDEFFGYGAEDVTLPTDPCDSKPVDDGMKLGRFEGFNNESDTEAPFSYIYADRHDRTCEVVRAGMKYMFSTGRGGLPGNNDTGALSSYYVFAALGLFPVAGQDLFLIGSPFVSKAVVELFNGNVLTITAANCSEENIYVESVKFNGMELDGFRVPASELLRGGKLEFVMTGKK